MRILVINSGSSSLKFSVFLASQSPGVELLLDGEIAGFGGKGATLAMSQGEEPPTKSDVEASTPEAAIHTVLQAIEKTNLPPVGAVGYRVVHPGAKLKGHQRVTDEVLRDLKDAAEFAPLHDPVALTIILLMVKLLPDIGHYVCFDTVFHETMPEEATV